MTGTEVVFWGSLAVAVYASGLYPLLVWIASRSRRGTPDSSVQRNAPLKSDAPLPKLTLLTIVHRDELSIVDWLQSALAQDYPASRLQILVGCVGEENFTGLLARSFDTERVEVIHLPRQTQASALNACVRTAGGEILVFSGPQMTLASDAARRLARHFQDAAVGGVCGSVKPCGSASRSLFDGCLAKLEEFIERSETRLGGPPPCPRGIYAVRKEAFMPLPRDAASDEFQIVARVCRQGRRLRYEEAAVATAGPPPAGETRTLYSLFTRTTLDRWRLLWPATNLRRAALGVIFCLHAALRALAPACLIAAMVSNACLCGDPFYLRCLLVHELFYLSALIGLLLMAAVRGRRTPMENAVPTNAPRPALARLFGDVFAGLSGEPKAAAAEAGSVAAPSAR